MKTPSSKNKFREWFLGWIFSSKKITEETWLKQEEIAETLSEKKNNLETKEKTKTFKEEVAEFKEKFAELQENLKEFDLYKEHAKIYFQKGDPYFITKVRELIGWVSYVEKEGIIVRDYTEKDVEDAKEEYKTFYVLLEESLKPYCSTLKEELFNQFLKYHMYKKYALIPLGLGSLDLKEA